MFPILFNKVGKIKLHPKKDKQRPISLMKGDTKIINKILSKRTNAKKQRKTIEWERLQIFSKKLEIPREYFMQSEVAQSCPTLSDPMDCSPPEFSVHGIFQAGVLEWGAIAFSKNTGVGCHSLLQEIFPTQGLNPALQHCRQMLYHLTHQGSWVKIPREYFMQRWAQ